MTDGRFYLLLALLLLALAGGEIVYAMVGPLSEPPRQLDELTSINRVPAIARSVTEPRWLFCCRGGLTVRS
jgi:hypothetical protein